MRLLKINDVLLLMCIFIDLKLQKNYTVELLYSTRERTGPREFVLFILRQVVTITNGEDPLPEAPLCTDLIWGTHKHI